ncbi:hypothetical protein [Marinobacterium sp. BA1]|uniref:hypothetical protein n=1 Tax=Marinobacterium sp. BA1 TaxID=3138931 RepID=UPI0032E6A5F2
MNEIEKMRSELERLQQRIDDRQATGISENDPVLARMIGRKVELERAMSMIERLREGMQRDGEIMNNMIAANQAAWIQWQRGQGAEAAMVWVHNGLDGLGLIPDESEAWSDDPQAYYDANKAAPFPVCHCGRPSNQLWMGHGACCHEHMKEIQQKEQANEA